MSVSSPSVTLAGNPETLRYLMVLLPKLSREGQTAIHLRFWKCMTIQEIAAFMRISWDHADQLIESSICQLREGFKSFVQERPLDEAS